MKFNRILIGIDDTKNAAFAAKQGFDLARTFNAEVGLVNVIEPIPNPSMETSGMAGTIVPGMLSDDTQIVLSQEEHSKNLLKDTIQRFAAGLTVTTYSEFGSTAENIIECSIKFKADLIVIGTHNRSGFDRLFWGNVADHVVRHSHIPVLVLPMPAEGISGILP